MEEAMIGAEVPATFEWLGFEHRLGLLILLDDCQNWSINGETAFATPACLGRAVVPSMAQWPLFVELHLVNIQVCLSIHWAGEPAFLVLSSRFSATHPQPFPSICETTRTQGWLVEGVGYCSWLQRYAHSFPPRKEALLKRKAACSRP